MILICGTPGTGKTTIANELKKYGFKVIHLGDFVIKEKLYMGYDKKRKTYIIDPEKVVEKLRNMQKNSKEPLIVEGVGAEIVPKELVEVCFVLICEPKELRKRLEAKGYPPEKIEENLEAERMSIILGEALDNYGEKTVVIDTTNTSVEEVVKKILEELKRRNIAFPSNERGYNNEGESKN
ncbi:MAG: adenylate kinase family protein [Candidatus Njordarchaeales archaeon]